MDKIDLVQMNQCVGKLKHLWVVIHEDAEGNQGILGEMAFMQDCFTGQLRRGAKPEFSPYESEVEEMEKYVKKLQAVIDPSGTKMTIKIKKFISND